jgi:hypothetical protein
MRRLRNAAAEPGMIGSVHFEERATAHSVSFNENRYDHCRSEPHTDHQSPKTPHERYGNPCADAGSNGKDSFWSFFSLGVAARKVIQRSLVSLEFQD